MKGDRSVLTTHMDMDGRAFSIVTKDSLPLCYFLNNDTGPYRAHVQFYLRNEGPYSGPITLDIASTVLKHHKGKYPGGIRNEDKQFTFQVESGKVYSVDVPLELKYPRWDWGRGGDYSYSEFVVRISRGDTVLDEFFFAAPAYFIEMLLPVTLHELEVVKHQQ